MGRGAVGQIDHSQSSVGKALGQSPDHPGQLCDDWMKMIMTMIRRRIIGDLDDQNGQDDHWL